MKRSSRIGAARGMYSIARRSCWLGMIAMSSDFSIPIAEMVVFMNLKSFQYCSLNFSKFVDL